VAKQQAIQLAFPGQFAVFVGETRLRRGPMKTWTDAAEFLAVQAAARAQVELRHPLRPASEREIYEAIGIGKTAYFAYVKRARVTDLRVNTAA
jgi:hypothetical protein